ALGEVGFSAERFRSVLDGMRHPPTELLALETFRQGAGAILVSRYLAEDAPDTIVALYLHPRADDAARQRVEQTVRSTDPQAMLTGYGRLEASLRQTLSRDLPRVGVVAAVLVLLALALSLRRARDVVLAMLVVVAEIGAVLLLIRLLEVPLHAYDALVLPVLLGITVDEGMFLLFRARRAARLRPAAGIVRETLDREGPPVAATALTTAAGFAGLIACDFDGLRHLGMVGALGSLVGLAIAVVVVPAGLRLVPAGAVVGASRRGDHRDKGVGV
ncbi:MAG: MMPL family transporter, partial [Deltaproteobacteria bacterium]|nr:MMPL family transporter [Deltaproteobacteria bacterium]MBW2536473.1 MMPL family transporter [Deltaproteobacteria bacterium]